MRALVKESAAPGAAIREVPVPEPGPGELLIRVEAASVCGTDVHIERWDPWAQENFGPVPMTFGHEMAGVVVKQGPGATRIAVGETVAVETHIVDWTCYQCRTGRAHVCQNMKILGVHMPGAFAEYVVLPEVNAWVYEGYSPEIAALQEPLGNAVHAAFVEEVAGQTAVVTGCGPIGLMAIGVLKMSGARAVFATDINEERRELAERMGADLVLDARDDVVGRLRAETDGNGVDIVLEMSGASPALHQGLAAVTNGGRVSLLGHAHGAGHDRPFRRGDLQGHPHLRDHGRRLFDTWYRTTALLEEGLDVSPIISHRLPLEDYAKAFDLVATGHAGKIVLLPQAG